MENILDSKTNKTQALVKLQVANENIEGASEALSEYTQMRLQLAMRLIEEAINYLTLDLSSGEESND